MVERRKWQLVDWCFFGVFTAMLMFEIISVFYSEETLLYDHKLRLMFIVISCYLVPLAFWRPGYVNDTGFAIAVLLTSGSFSIYLTHLLQQPVGLLSIPVSIVALLARRPTLWWNLPVYLVGFPVVFYFMLRHPGIYSLFNWTFNMMMNFGIGILMRMLLNSSYRTKALLAENDVQYRMIHEQNKVLEQYSQKVEQLTLTEERNRMARELHDTVGHTFTSVIMGMDAVSYLIDAAPEKAKERLDVLRSVTRNGLEEVRRSIHQIAPRDSGDTLTQLIAQLSNEFAVHTGTIVEVVTDGEEPDSSKQTKLTLIRCLQESLTNAKRHGHAKTIAVRLYFNDAHTTLTIEDDGIGSADLSAGFGLTAMKERLSALQGTLSVTSSPKKGTTVTCIVPNLPS